MADNKLKNTLWVESYRPSTLNDYIGNDDLKKTIQHYIDNNDVPHLLFYGRQGTGKTSLAKIIVNAIDADLLYLNASDENSINTIRTKIKSFVSSVGFKTWKVVILDESDYLSPEAMASLRHIMEQFSAKSRFILTCNYVEKIIAPIKSRCNMYEIHPPSKKEVATKMVDILTKENVQYDLKDLAIIINNSYPDIRAIINTIQQQSLSGTLTLSALSVAEQEYMMKIKNVLMNIHASTPEAIFNNIRQILADSKLRTFDELYRYLYDNIEEIAPSGKRSNVILEIAKAMQTDVWVVDKEINVASMFIEIIYILKQ